MGVDLTLTKGTAMALPVHTVLVKPEVRIITISDPELVRNREGLPGKVSLTYREIEALGL